MPYQPSKKGFAPGGGHADLRGQFNSQVGGFTDVEVVIICGDDGKVVYLVKYGSDTGPGAGINFKEFKYVYVDGPSAAADAKEGAASDPCFTYDTGAGLEEVCW